MKEEMSDKPPVPLGYRAENPRRRWGRIILVAFAISVPLVVAGAFTYDWIDGRLHRPRAIHITGTPPLIGPPANTPHPATQNVNVVDIYEYSIDPATRPAISRPSILLKDQLRYP
jgi:hypothetical protein